MTHKRKVAGRQKPEVSMHFGAAHNTITVDGIPFDLGELTRPEFKKLRRMTIDVLVACGFCRIR